MNRITVKTELRRKMTRRKTLNPLGDGITPALSVLEW
jgi:hypothetical protein